MIARDLGDFLRNPDGTAKGLGRVRQDLFGAGCGHMQLHDDVLQISFDQAFTVPLTNALRTWHELLERRHRNGLGWLGGLHLRYRLRPPHGQEHRNALKKVPLPAVLAGAHIDQQSESPRIDQSLLPSAHTQFTSYQRCRMPSPAGLFFHLPASNTALPCLRSAAGHPLQAVPEGSSFRHSICLY